MIKCSEFVYLVENINKILEDGTKSKKKRNDLYLKRCTLDTYLKGERRNDYDKYIGGGGNITLSGVKTLGEVDLLKLLLKQGVSNLFKDVSFIDLIPMTQRGAMASHQHNLYSVANLDKCTVKEVEDENAHLRNALIKDECKISLYNEDIVRIGYLVGYNVTEENVTLTDKDLAFIDAVFDLFPHVKTWYYS